MYMTLVFEYLYSIHKFDCSSTAYIKMIDVWLIFAMLIPFMEVLLHTYMETLRDREEDSAHILSQESKSN